VTSEVRVIAAREQGGYAEAETMMKRLATVPALVLDDLGGERMRAEYEDDWVASMLDLLIDRRHNAMLPTWYTTNLARNEFMDRYGARLLSRLCGENTLVTVPAGPDMRMRDARSR
jgi:DNA replication protein DnaC